MTESYRQKRIDALTRIKNEMKISNANVTQLELEIIEDQIVALQNGIEIERNEIGPEIITVSP